MKTYICKQCGFSGTRQMVRNHMKEEHRIGIRVWKGGPGGEKHKSEITPKIEVVDF